MNRGTDSPIQNWNGWVMVYGGGVGSALTEMRLAGKAGLPFLRTRVGPGRRHKGGFYCWLYIHRAKTQRIIYWHIWHIHADIAVKNRERNDKKGGGSQEPSPSFPRVKTLRERKAYMCKSGVKRRFRVDAEQGREEWCGETWRVQRRASGRGHRRSFTSCKRAHSISTPLPPVSPQPPFLLALSAVSSALRTPYLSALPAQRGATPSSRTLSNASWATQNQVQRWEHSHILNTSSSSHLLSAYIAALY